MAIKITKTVKGTTDPRLTELRKKFNNGRRLAVCNPFDEVKKPTRVSGIYGIEDVQRRLLRQLMDERVRAEARERQVYEETRRRYIEEQERGGTYTRKIYY